MRRSIIKKLVASIVLVSAIIFSGLPTFAQHRSHKDERNRTEKRKYTKRTKGHKHNKKKDYHAKSHKKPISVPLTQILLFPRYGMDVTLAYPQGYDMPDWAVEKARKNALENGGSFTITHNMEEAFKDADIVIPKNWGSWVNNQSDAVVDDLLESYKSWKCTEEMISIASPNVHYMHALPADRGNEVVDSVIDGKHSIVYQEAENRLHTAKAVMAMTIGDK